jgi:hypothetical protein
MNGNKTWFLGLLYAVQKLTPNSKFQPNVEQNDRECNLCRASFKKSIASFLYSANKAKRFSEIKTPFTWGLQPIAIY